jgi:hypothetical protein
MLRFYSVNFIIIPKFGDTAYDLLDRAVNDTGPYADCTICGNLTKFMMPIVCDKK